MSNVSKKLDQHHKAAMLTVMSRHIGRGNGISARYLATYLGTSQRRLRKLISLARYEDGAAICGHPNTGYFMAQTPEELEMSCAFLRHRAVHSLQLLSRMTKTSMPDLVGQLKLNQA